MKPLPKQVQAQADFVTSLDQPTVIEQPPVVTAEPVPPEVRPPEPSRQEDWEHKYKTLQGIFNSAQQRNQQQIQELTETVQKLTDKMNKPVSAPVREVESRSSLVTKEDEKAFGADLIDVARRVAQEELAGRQAAYTDEIKRLEGLLNKTDGRLEETNKRHEETAWSEFLSRLTERLPTWEAIQNTADCQAWLTAAVPGMQFTWNEALLSAANRRNVGDVLTIFNQFFVAFPDHNPAKVVVPVEPASNGLASQVTPGKSKTSSVVTAAQPKKVYTSSEYVNESNKVVRLTKAGNTKAAEQLQADLDSAMMENRVRP